MTLTLNLDLDIIQIHLHTKFHGPRCYNYRNMNYCPVNFRPITGGQKVMHKSPPAPPRISTGRLKNKQKELQLGRLDHHTPTKSRLQEHSFRGGHKGVKMFHLPLTSTINQFLPRSSHHVPRNPSGC